MHLVCPELFKSYTYVYITGCPAIRYHLSPLILSPLRVKIQKKKTYKKLCEHVYIFNNKGLRIGENKYDVWIIRQNKLYMCIL